jgi:hypothetical protein
MTDWLARAYLGDNAIHIFIFPFSTGAGPSNTRLHSDESTPRILAKQELGRGDWMGGFGRKAGWRLAYLDLVALFFFSFFFLLGRDWRGVQGGFENAPWSLAMGTKIPRMRVEVG